MSQPDKLPVNVVQAVILRDAIEQKRSQYLKAARTFAEDQSLGLSAEKIAIHVENMNTFAEECDKLLARLPSLETAAKNEQAGRA